MKDRKAMQQALEALELLSQQPIEMALDYADNAIEVLRERLAQPEQESFSPEAISATQAAWKMGYAAAKAEQPAQEPVTITNEMAFAFHSALTDGAIGEGEVEEIKTGLAAAFAHITAPPQRKPLTDEQRKDLMNKAWDKWLSGKDDNHLFAWHFSFEVEAAHGIKGTT